MRYFLFIFLLPCLAFSQLKYSADSLYLVKQDGTPVFLTGSSPWTIFTNTKYRDAQRFIDSCYTHKINYIQAMAVVSSGLAGTANENGAEPFVSSQHFNSTPNESYWKYVDSVIAYAHSKGIYTMLYPAYLGASSWDGWVDEVDLRTKDEMKTWGQWIGGRYKDSSSVLWGIGGDRNPETGGHVDKMDSLARGIVAAGATQLMESRDDIGTTRDSYYSNSKYTWYTLNYQYPYWGTSVPHLVLDNAKVLRRRIPKMPSGLEEATYENENDWTATIVRQQAYYSILGGSLGYQITCACPIWHFSQVNSGQCSYGVWQNWLDAVAMKTQKYFDKIVTRHRPWYKFIPDTSNTVMTAGKGTGEDLAQASRASDSTCIMVYMSSNRLVTIQTDWLRNRSGDQVRVSWLHPDDGDSVYVTTINSHDGEHSYTPSGSADFVLALDLITGGEPAVEVKKFIYLK